MSLSSPPLSWSVLVLIKVSGRGRNCWLRTIIGREGTPYPCCLSPTIWWKIINISTFISIFETPQSEGTDQVQDLPSLRSQWRCCISYKLKLILWIAKTQTGVISFAKLHRFVCCLTLVVFSFHNSHNFLNFLYWIIGFPPPSLSAPHSEPWQEVETFQTSLRSSEGWREDLVGAGESRGPGILTLIGLDKVVKCWDNLTLPGATSMSVFSEIITLSSDWPGFDKMQRWRFYNLCSTPSYQATCSCHP